MRPYRTAENKIDGVLMALMDIDVLKRGLNQARLSLGEAVAERDLSASLLDISGALIVIWTLLGALSPSTTPARRSRATPYVR